MSRRTVTFEMNQATLPLAQPVRAVPACEICGGRGSFGYRSPGWEALRSEEPRWFCRDHRPDTKQVRAA